MLLPRGRPSKGMKFDLFVMVTDWALEKRGDTDDLDRGTSYCGMKDQVYPDGRAMGFPFDRKLDAYGSVSQFAKSNDNMATVPIRIIWRD